MSLDNSPVQLELRRLAHVLHIGVEEVEGLAPMGATDLRVLREQVMAKLFDEGADSWERAVAVSGVVPTGLAAKLTERALGPVLAARVTAHAPPEKANDIGGKLSPSFMADIAVHVDPRHIGDLAATMPGDRVAAIGRELAAREEYLVMADFVTALPEQTLRATVEALPDHALVLILVLVEDPERITQVVALLDDRRVMALRALADHDGLEAHLSHITDVVDDTQRARLTAA